MMSDIIHKLKQQNFLLIHTHNIHYNAHQNTNSLPLQNKNVKTTAQEEKENLTILTTD